MKYYKIENGIEPPLLYRVTEDNMIQEYTDQMAEMCAREIQKEIDKEILERIENLMK